MIERVTEKISNSNARLFAPPEKLSFSGRVLSFLMQVAIISQLKEYF